VSRSQSEITAARRLIVLVRLTVRVGLAGGTRTLLLALLVLLPMTMLVAGIGIANSITETISERQQSVNQGDYSTVLLNSSTSVGADLAAAELALQSSVDVISPKIVVSEPGVAVSRQGRGTTAYYLELNWSQVHHDDTYRMLTGTEPARPFDVALSGPVADRLNAKVGDQVDIGFNSKPLTIVGTFVDRLSLSNKQILAGAGTWQELKPPTVGFLPASIGLIIDLGDVNKQDVESRLGAQFAEWQSGELRA
jgi:predicted lysophospholipase L1 biosynthesis ABC-type transport system permease subunit